ncbi:MAG: response regulator transcription factor [Herpetosiphonaceae bacterium]|nr:response regulator transcription factor [Herpetosiphonaceae bacterium]
MTGSTGTRQTILVVEDTDLIAEFVVSHLEAAGYQTAVAISGEEAIDMLKTLRPALIVLDVVLDGIDGFEVCRRIRQNAFNGLATVANVPVLMLSARAAEADRLDGFNAGVDDYLSKPFSPDELLARIQAILRRANGIGQLTLQVGDLTIDPFQRVVRAGDTVLDLTPKEFDLLHLLASHPGQVMPRALLLERVWGYTQDCNTRTVDVHIQRLREKLDAQPTSAGAIQTEWGVGYKMVV